VLGSASGELLRQGSEPQTYAEGILKVCEFYLESPLVCVAGVTGSNLKQRIEEIMVHRIARKLNLAKKLVLATAAAAALALPVIFGLLHPQASHAQSQQSPASSAVQEVSILPAGTMTPGGPVSMRFLQQNGTLDVKNITLQHLIHYAFDVNAGRITGAPDWMASDLYDITAKIKEDIGSDQVKLAFQNIISQRFKLAAHHEWRNAPVYELVIGPNGPKFAAAHPKKELDRIMVNPVGHMEATNVKMAELVKFLQDSSGQVVVDKTGLNGTYDFTLNAEGMAMGPSKSPAGLAALQKAVSEQLGLELNQQSGMVDTLVIDHVEKIPAEGGGR